MNKEIALISEKISETGKNVIFTGAGISTESGIPDYRSKGGIWDKFRPVYFDEFMSSKEARIEYWRRWSELYQDLTQAKPNHAHLAITKLHEMGLLEAVITQNIDGLHQQGGLPDDKIIELHGSTRRIRCMRCSKISSIQEAKKRLDALSEVREDKVAEIRGQIDAGTYHIDSEKIAFKMIRESILDELS